MAWTSVLFPLLALHRWTPERTLPELLAATRRGHRGVRAMVAHLGQCRVCIPAALNG